MILGAEKSIILLFPPNQFLKIIHQFFGHGAGVAVTDFLAVDLDDGKDTAGGVGDKNFVGGKEGFVFNAFKSAFARKLDNGFTRDAKKDGFVGGVTDSNCHYCRKCHFATADAKTAHRHINFPPY